jgi:Ca-activated chloride channel family protein
MNEKLGNESKFSLACRHLLHTIDSIQNTNSRMEFALRVMGHQSARDENNCKDSKLEVPFSAKNSGAIRQAISGISPKGQTPIVYSLKQALKDFPDTTSVNAILLITDGLETCGDEICSVAPLFQKSRIALKPFIIGLGLNDSLQKKFSCAGYFFGAKDDSEFQRQMNVVVRRTLNATTVQLNLLNGLGEPTETNTEITLSEHFSGKVRYQFMHTINKWGNPDSLKIDPRFLYDLKVHTIPPVELQKLELLPGRHSTWAVNVPQGELNLKIQGTMPKGTLIPCLVRQHGKSEILSVQDFGSTQKYLAGFYDLEVLSIPRKIYENVELIPGKSVEMNLPVPGTLTVTPAEAGVASVFIETGKQWVKVFDFYDISHPESVQLQPGEYFVVYRPEKARHSERSKTQKLMISSGKTTHCKT